MTWLKISKTPVVLFGACVAIALSAGACAGESEKTPLSEAELGWNSGQSVVELPDDVVGMSGDYQVTREGKLLPYAAIPPAKKPELDEIATVNDNNGAEAFARYFIRVVEYTWNSGDSSLLREISLPSCTWCEHMANTTDEDAANKGWVEGLLTEIKQIDPAFEVPDHQGLWHVVAHVENSKYKFYDGATLHEIQGKSAEFQIQLRYQDGNWRISEAMGEEEKK